MIEQHRLFELAAMYQRLNATVAAALSYRGSSVVAMEGGG